jgi:hypothetical protein
MSETVIVGLAALESATALVCRVCELVTDLKALTIAFLTIFTAGRRMYYCCALGQVVEQEKDSD